MARVVRIRAPRIVPAGLPPWAGILSHVGAIALNGVLDARR